MQIRVEEFFDLFFSDDALDFLESFHRTCGDKGTLIWFLTTVQVLVNRMVFPFHPLIAPYCIADFRCSSWYPRDNFGHARDMSFKHPIKLYLGNNLFSSLQNLEMANILCNGY